MRIAYHSTEITPYLRDAWLVKKFLRDAWFHLKIRRDAWWVPPFTTLIKDD